MQTQRAWQTAFSELAGSRLTSFDCFKVKNENIFSLKAKLPSGEPVFVKYFSGQNGAEEAEKGFGAISKYYSAMPRSLGYTCARPIDCWTDTRLGGAYLLEWIEGRRGDDYFKSFSPFESLRTEGIRRSAEWLGIFHSIGSVGSATLQDFLDLDSVAIEITRSTFDNGSKSKTSSILSVLLLQERITGLKEAKVSITRVHGDFTPANLFINRDKLVGFDFTADVVAPAMTDVASFLLPLLWYGSLKDLGGKGKRFRSDLELFLNSYTKYSPAPSLDVSILFCLIELMRRQQILKKQIAEVGLRKRWSKLAHLKATQRVFLHMTREFA